MDNKIILLDALAAGSVADNISRLTQSAKAFALHSRADTTLRAYRSHWKSFSSFCDQNNLPSLPTIPAAVALFLTHRVENGAKVATLRAALASIRSAHRSAGLAVDLKHPELEAVWSGIRRDLGTRPNRKSPVLSDDLKRMIGSLNRTSLAGQRDALLMLVGFGAALRRSELVALRFSDITIMPEGLKIFVPRSKTDQEGVGVEIAITRGRTADTCAVAAFVDWKKSSGLTDGPVFRRIRRGGVSIGSDQLTDRAVADIVKRMAGLAGLDPNLYSGHSLRAGLATSAALAGAQLTSIMRQTRHVSPTVASSYVRDANLWRDNVSALVL